MPRHLLCRHFWTEEEQAQFGEQALRKRTQHYPKILHYMEKHSRDVKDPGHRRLLEGIIHKVSRSHLFIGIWYSSSCLIYLSIYSLILSRGAVV